MSWTITPQTKVPVDPFRSQVSLLLHGDGTNGSTTITDSSPTPKTVTAFGNAQISTAQSKFGGSSIAFDGTGDYLTTSQNNDFTVGTGDFTIEFWVWVPAIPTTGFPAICISNSATPINQLFINFRNNNTIALTTGFSVFAVSPGIAASTWSHIAVVRSSGNTVAYTQGIGGSPVACSIDFAGNAFFIGGAASGNWINGYIDDFRITKGVARYTSNFTPPTAPFPDI